MTIYVLPPSSSLEAVNEVLLKAGIKLASFAHLREYIVAEAAAGPITVATLTSQSLLILNRFASELVVDLPTIIMSAPGAVYTGEWVSLGSAFPSIDWLEFSRKTARSGHLALTPDTLTTRGVGGQSSTIASFTGLRARSEQAELADEDSIDAETGY